LRERLKQNRNRKREINNKKKKKEQEVLLSLLQNCFTQIWEGASQQPHFLLLKDFSLFSLPA